VGILVSRDAHNRPKTKGIMPLQSHNRGQQGIPIVPCRINFPAAVRESKAERVACVDRALLCTPPLCLHSWPVRFNFFTFYTTTPSSYEFCSHSCATENLLYKTSVDNVSVPLLPKDKAAR